MWRFWDRIKTGLIHAGLVIIGVLLPDRGKRILMLTTLQMQLVHEGIFHEDALDRFNVAMNLVTQEDALLFPANVYRSVWEHTALKENMYIVEGFDFTNSCLPYEEAQRLAQTLARDVVPSWLRYGPKQGDMVTDIIRLFYCQPSLSRQLVV